MLDACTQHTNDVHASVRDWLKMQFHGKSFADMKQRLASYKSTLNIAFASINIKDHSATQESLTEMKGLIEGTKEDLNDQVEKVEEAIRDAAESLQDRLRADSAQLKGALQTLARAQQVANATRPQIVIEQNRTGKDGRAIFGTDVLRSLFDLRVSGNVAEERATMAAGVHSSESLQALLRASGKPEVALMMQTLQGQLRRPDTDMPQDGTSRSEVSQQMPSFGERRSIEHHLPPNNLSEESSSPQRSNMPGQSNDLAYMNHHG